jgi:hypothetical protein
MVTFRHIKSPYFEGKKSHCRQPYLVAGFLRGKKITCRRHIYSPYFEGKKVTLSPAIRSRLFFWRKKKSHVVVKFSCHILRGKKSHFAIFRQ